MPQVKGKCPKCGASLFLLNPRWFNSFKNAVVRCVGKSCDYERSPR